MLALLLLASVAMAAPQDPAVVPSNYFQDYLQPTSAIPLSSSQLDQLPILYSVVVRPEHQDEEDELLDDDDDDDVLDSEEEDEETLPAIYNYSPNRYITCDNTRKGPFRLRDSIISVYDNLITFNNGLGPLKTKSGYGFQGGGCVERGFYVY